MGKYKETKTLIKDLEELNIKYLGLNPKNKPIPINKSDVKKEKGALVKSGKLMIDFYQKIFVPKYSQNQNHLFQEANECLNYFAYLAEKSIKNNNYFGLAVLLIPKENKISDPNLLESLIWDIKHVKKE